MTFLLSLWRHNRNQERLWIELHLARVPWPLSMNLSFQHPDFFVASSNDRVKNEIDFAMYYPLSSVEQPQRSPFALESNRAIPVQVLSLFNSHGILISEDITTCNRILSRWSVPGSSLCWIFTSLNMMYFHRMEWPHLLMTRYISGR